jgi:hypothetical protein
VQSRTINSIYKQFYVADLALNPPAPEEWTDEDVARRYNSEENIVALCPEGDVTARIVVVPPGSTYDSEALSDFEVSAQVSIESGKLGVLEWPWELVQEFDVVPGKYQITYRGYDTHLAQTEGDYYVVEIAAT